MDCTWVTSIEIWFIYADYLEDGTETKHVQFISIHLGLEQFCRS